MKDVIMKELLGVEIKALCNDGQVHTITLGNFVGAENSTISTDRKMIDEVLKHIIDIHLECASYDTVVDGVKLDLLSFGEENMEIRND